VVPKFTVITGHSYGAGNYAMCGKAYDPRLILAWPSAEIAVMGGEQASKVLLQIQNSARKSQGLAEDPEAEKERLLEIKARYTEQTKPIYAASRLWVDGLIDPVKTRDALSIGLDAANHAPMTERFNMGVLQV
jgi:acetyl-CoA carboxylase carboxyltransferase component